MLLLVDIVLGAMALGAAILIYRSSMGSRPTTPAGTAPPLLTGRWEAAHVGSGGSTMVVVRRGDDTREVGRVRDDAEDWTERFLALMAQARERAAVLNSEA